MVPLGTLADVRDVSGPVMITRYNMYPAAADQRQRRAGRQLRRGDRDCMEDAGRQELPPAHARPNGPSWPCSQIADRQHGDASSSLLAVVLVFLVLAAQYESWSLPLAVILVVPMCLLCSVAGVVAGAAWTSTSSRRSASWCWSAWPARTRS